MDGGEGDELICRAGGAEEEEEEDEPPPSVVSTGAIGRLDISALRPAGRRDAITNRNNGEH